MDIQPKAKPKRQRKAQMKFSRALVDAICARIADGETWNQIGKETGMPGKALVETWRRQMPEVEDAWRQAMELAGQARFDEMMSVVAASTPATVTADRLKIDVLKYQAEKLAPRRFVKGAEPLDARTYVGTVYEQDPTTGEVTARAPAP